MSKNSNLTELSMKELLEYECAASLLCRKYEKETMTYQGLSSNPADSQVMQKFRDMGRKHLNILNELENRLSKLD